MPLLSDYQQCQNTRTAFSGCSSYFLIHIRPIRLRLFNLSGGEQIAKQSMSMKQKGAFISFISIEILTGVKCENSNKNFLLNSAETAGKIRATHIDAQTETDCMTLDTNGIAAENWGRNSVSKDNWR